MLLSKPPVYLEQNPGPNSLLFATFSGLLQVSQKTENEKKALNQKYEGLKDSSPVYEAEQILL